jgi:hypothetical protein
MKFLVYLSSLLLIAYNLHAGLTAQEVGIFGLDVKFVRTGDTIHPEPAVGPPVILRTAENSVVAGGAGGKVNPTATAQPTTAAKQATTVVAKSTPASTPAPPAPTTRPSDLCVQGFVWREATPTDHVCVTPQTRTQVQLDNQRAATRWTFGQFGPDTCVSGFVWREATTSDHVCVTPQTRDQTAADNQQAQSRIQR